MAVEKEVGVEEKLKTSLNVTQSTGGKRFIRQFAAKSTRPPSKPQSSGSKPDKAAEKPFEDPHIYNEETTRVKLREQNLTERLSDPEIIKNHLRVTEKTEKTDVILANDEPLEDERENEVEEKVFMKKSHDAIKPTGGKRF